MSGRLLVTNIQRVGKRKIGDGRKKRDRGGRDTDFVSIPLSACACVSLKRYNH